MAAKPSQPSITDIGALRVIDAAANRVREGLRVVEDYVRFVLDDRHLTEQCREIRHQFVAAIERIGHSDRLAARETQADVGAQVPLSSTTVRKSAADLLAANFARIAEGLRSLEEFGKLGNMDASCEFQQLRYRVYTLQRAAEITRSSLDRLASAKLYVLIDGAPSLGDFNRLVNLLVAAGVDMIQLRDKRLDDQQLLDRARALRSATRSSRTLCIVNDRADLAVLARADGVHVGQGDIRVKDARTIVGPHALVGVSTHGIEQVRQAVLDGANYIGVGPVFPSATKHFEDFPGLELLRVAASEVRLPAFAIGGITCENLPQVLATGFSRVAVGGAIRNSPDPAAMVRRFREMLSE